MPNQSQHTPRFRAALQQVGGEQVGELYVYDEIGPGFCGGLSAQDVIRSLDEMRGAGRVEVYINSPGGDSFEGMAIYNALKRLQCSKTVHIDGVAASIASIIAMAGDRIVTAPNAMWMIHEPWACQQGTAEELRKKADLLDQVRGTMADTYAARTGLKRDDVLAMMAAETWMTAAEAKAKGFTDEIEGEAAEPEAPADPTAIPLVAAMYRHAPNAQRIAALLSIPPKAAKSGEEQEMKTILSALGLAETATEAEALEKLKARTAEAETAKANAKQIEAELLALTGKATVSEAMGVLAANKQAAAQLEQAIARVQALEAEKRDAEVEGIVQALRGAGKLSSAMEPWARNLGRKDLATLKAFAASAPKIIPLGEQARPPRPAAAKKWTEMSYAEKAELWRTDKALYEQMKAESEK